MSAIWTTLPQPPPGGNRITAVGVLDRSVALLELLGDGPRSLRDAGRGQRAAAADRAPAARRARVARPGRRGTADGAFRLGPRLTELAAAGRAAGWTSPRWPARCWTGCTSRPARASQLYLRSGDRRLCVAARDAGSGLRDSVPVGALLPLDAGSGGKVLLAWSDRRRPVPRGAGGRAGRDQAARLGGERRGAGGRGGQRQRAGPGGTGGCSARYASPARPAGLARRPAAGSRPPSAPRPRAWPTRSASYLSGSEPGRRHGRPATSPAPRAAPSHSRPPAGQPRAVLVPRPATFGSWDSSWVGAKRHADRRIGAAESCAVRAGRYVQII